jgi:hypothetical protein
MMDNRFSFEQAACEACKRFVESTCQKDSDSSQYVVQENNPPAPTIASALITDEND